MGDVGGAGPDESGGFGGIQLWHVLVVAVPALTAALQLYFRVLSTAWQKVRRLYELVSGAGKRAEDHEGGLVALVTGNEAELRREIECAAKTLRQKGFKVCLGTQESVGVPPGEWHRDLADKCDLCICLLGSGYGAELAGDVRSSTDLHCRTAATDDAGKVLVYVKDGSHGSMGSRQKSLFGFVCGAEEHGVSHKVFTSQRDLRQKLTNDVGTWRDNRAKLAGHFIRSRRKTASLKAMRRAIKSAGERRD